MAIWTSQRSGSWSVDAAYGVSPWNSVGINPANGIPADGDTVYIQPGHIVTFDADQSAWAGGLAALVINGTLAASETPGSYYLKMAGNITSDGYPGSERTLRAGQSPSIRYPSACKFTIYFNSTANRQINCSNGLTCLFYCARPVREWTRIVNSVEKAITAIATGTTTTVTCPGHGFSASSIIYLSKIGGLDRLSGQRLKVASVVDADHFTLAYGNYSGTMGIDSTGWGTYSGGGYAYPTAANASGDSTIYLEDDVSADPEWLRAGAEVGIFSNGSHRYIHSIVGVGAGTLFLSPATSTAFGSGGFVVLLTRNIQVYHTTSTSGNGGTTGTIYTGSGHVLDCELRGTGSTATGERAVYSSTFTFTCGAHYNTNGGWSSCTLTQSGGFSAWHYGYNHNATGCFLSMTGGLQGPNYNTFVSCCLDISGGIIAWGLGPFNGCRGRFTGSALMTCCGNNHQYFNIGMVYAGGRIQNMSGPGIVNEFNFVLCGTEILDCQGQGITNSSGRISSGSIIGCTNGMANNGTILVSGGQIKDCGTLFTNHNTIIGSNLWAGWSAGKAGNTAYQIVDYAAEQNSRDGIWIRDYNGASGELWAWMPGGLIYPARAEYDDPIFTVGPTWVLQAQSTHGVPVWYEQRIRGKAGQKIAVDFTYESGAGGWVQDPKVEIFKAGEDPWDGHTALASAGFTNDWAEHSDSIEWTPAEDGDYIVRVSAINPSGYFYFAWAIDDGDSSGGASPVFVVED